MSFIDCVNNAVAGGELNDELAGRALNYYDRMVKKFKAEGHADAEKKAAEFAAKKSEDSVKESARRKFLQARAQKKIQDEVASYTRVSGKANPREAGLAIIDSGGLQGVNPGVDQVRDTIKDTAHSMLASLLFQQRKTVTGATRDETSLINIVKEIFGESTGSSEARQLADAWKETAEWLRNEYNNAGGRIAFRKDWGMPQRHDWIAIKNAGLEKWKADVMPRLDLKRMAEMYEVGEEQIDEVLNTLYRTLSTNGAVEIDLDNIGLDKALYNRRTESRFLAFKGADNWLGYQTNFGSGDPFEIMMRHVDEMSADIAAMRRLGPNADRGIEAVKLTVKKHEGELGIKGDSGKSIQTIWDLYTGVTNIPENAKWAKRFSNTRATLGSAQLGSAVISATSDLGFVSMTASFNGMSSTKVMKRALKILDGASREEIVRAGHVAETWADAATTMARFHDDALTSPFFQRMIGTVLKTSGLNFWTDTMRWSFKTEANHFVSSNAARTFSELPQPLQNSFKRYNISPQDWEIIRATKQHNLGDGTGLIRIQDLMRRNDIEKTLAEDLGFKLSNFINSEAAFAVPTSSLRGKAALGNLPPAGTFWGEVVRSGLMYKNFAITMYMTHLRRAIDEMSQGRKGYAAAVVIIPTLMGAMALQLKQMKDGKEPLDMTKPSFWPRAMTQGGGLGIFGDFLIKDHNRFGGSLAETVGGPVVGAATDAVRVGQSLTIDAARDGEVARRVSKSAGIASKYVPGSSLWYLAAPYRRAVQDNLKALGSKRPRSALRKMARDRQRNEGSGFWWEPGEATPF